MMKSLEFTRLKTSSHSAFRLFYHLVLSMKYRHSCLTPEMLDRLEDLLRGLLTRWGCELVEFGGEADHVHVLFEANPTVKLSDLVKNLKSVSARHMRKEYATHLASYYGKPYFWNHAYALVSVGGRANIDTLLRYIENQDDPRKLGQPLD